MTYAMTTDEFDRDPAPADNDAPHYPMVAAAIRYLVEHYAEQPSLEEVAAIADNPG